MLETHPCPKCNRQLRRGGEVAVEGERLSVFQCDECLSAWDFDGERFETALTFAVDAAGRLLDPESLEPLDLSSRAK